MGDATTALAPSTAVRFRWAFSRGAAGLLDSPLDSASRLLTLDQHLEVSNASPSSSTPHLGGPSIEENAVPRDPSAEPVVRLAEPVGGLRAYNKYMENNLSYPQQALDNNIRGRVGVQFTVGTDGSLYEFKVTKSLGFGCDEEVIRLVKEGPAWRPSSENNVPTESTVRVRMRFDPSRRK